MIWGHGRRGGQPLRRRIGGVGCSVAVVVLGLGAPTPARAQADADTDPTEAAEPFYGTFYLLPGAGDDPTEVVDRGVSLVRSWLKRPFARGRIREVTIPFEWFQLFKVDAGVRVSTPRWSIDVPLAGPLEGWEMAEDDFVDVSIEWTGEAWVQRFDGVDGSRINRYELGEDGHTVSLRARITSTEFTAPLEYELVFERR